MLDLVFVIIGLVVFATLCALINFAVKNDEAFEDYNENDVNAPCTEEDYNFRLVIK